MADMINLAKNWAKVPRSSKIVYMKARYRYSLIALGFAIFFTISPMIVIFVSGYRYDFTNKHFVKTGAISIKTDPSKATVTINGKVSGKTPDSARFLLPGEYDVSVSKTGYFTWSKKMTVSPQNVTVANYGYNAIDLLYSKTINTDIQNGVSSFFAGDKRVIYVNSGKIYTSDINNLQKSSFLDLPEELQTPKIIASTDENYFLLQDPNNNINASIFSIPDNKIFDLKNLLSGVKEINLQFGNNGNLYAVENGNFFQLDWRNGKIIPIIQNGGIKCITFHDNNIYALAADNSKTPSESEVIENINTSSNQATILYSGLTNWQNSEITFNKLNQIGILGDGNLYILLNSKTQEVQQYVVSMNALNGSSQIMYATNNELGLVDLNNGNIQLITRLSKQISSPAISLETGWAYYISDGNLNAIELDRDYGQNIYQITQTSNGATFTLDSAGKYIYLLDSGNLKRLQIR